MGTQKEITWLEFLGGSPREVFFWGKGFIHSSQEGQWKAGKHHGRGPQPIYGQTWRVALSYAYHIIHHQYLFNFLNLFSTSDSNSLTQTISCPFYATDMYLYPIPVPKKHPAFFRKASRVGMHDLPNEPGRGGVRTEISYIE